MLMIKYKEGKNATFILEMSVNVYFYNERVKNF